MADGESASASDESELEAPASANSTAVGSSTPTSRATDASTLRAAVLQTLQGERQRCGFSTLASDASLDQAASNHGVYLANEYANGRKGAHTETSGTAGFTGETPAARATAAGYPSRSVSEAFAHSNLAATDTAITSASAPTDRAVSHTKFLLSTVYHMLALLAPKQDLGIGYAEQRGASVFTQVTVMELGVKTGRSNAPQSAVLTYPCEGTTAVRASFVPSKETPNPLPSAGAGTVGTPLYLRAPEGSTLVLDSHSVTDPSGHAVATTILNSSNDPEKRLTNAQLFLVPQSALTPGANYQVIFTGNVNGIPFNRAFRFTPS